MIEREPFVGRASLLHHLGKVVLCAVVIFIPAQIHATELLGEVVGVADGDTVTVLDAGKVQHRVRLKGIDAPDMQAFGQRSKESLSRLVFRQPVRVEWEKRDRYKRISGKVWVASPDSACRGAPTCRTTTDASLAQITTGLAWWCRKYADEQSAEDRERYEFAEVEARSRRVGLWREPAPVAPWDWRRR